MKKKQIRSFSQELKIEAVKLAESSDKSKEQIPRELEVSSTKLYNWRRKCKNSELGNTMNGLPLYAEQRIKQLEIENARLRKDRDILKKVNDASRQQQIVVIVILWL